MRARAVLTPPAREPHMPFFNDQMVVRASDHDVTRAEPLPILSL